MKKFMIVSCPMFLIGCEQINTVQIVDIFSKVQGITELIYSIWPFFP